MMSTRNRSIVDPEITVKISAGPSWTEDARATGIGSGYAELASGVVNLNTDASGTPRGAPMLFRTSDQVELSFPLRVAGLAEAAAVLNATNPDAAYLDAAGLTSGALVLWHRGMSIAGGTSEIKRNQIGERILGLPRDPLIK